MFERWVALPVFLPLAIYHSTVLSNCLVLVADVRTSNVDEERKHSGVVEIDCATM